jgi:hypothetical protein
LLKEKNPRVLGHGRRFTDTAEARTNWDSELTYIANTRDLSGSQTSLLGAEDGLNESEGCLVRIVGRTERSNVDRVLSKTTNRRKNEVQHLHIRESPAKKKPQKKNLSNN